MTLSLSLGLGAARVPVASALDLEITLLNAGTSDFETASLDDNSLVLNVEIYDHDDRLQGSYNDVSRQELEGVEEPEVGQFRLVRLSSGGHEVRQLALAHWHWIDKPGVYFLRAHYRWKDVELRSPPQRLEILPAPLDALDLQWAYHYGEKSLLDSVWSYKNEEGQYAVVLRRSLRFRPQVVESLQELHRQDTPCLPKVSFNASLEKSGPVWVSWIQDTEVLCIRSGGNQPFLGPLRLAAGLPLVDWVGPPLATESGELRLLCTAIGHDGTTKVVAMAVDRHGDFVKREEWARDFSQAKNLCVAFDTDGECTMYWCEDRDLWSLDIDFTSLLPEAEPVRLWQAPKEIVAICLPPVFDDEFMMSCLYADTNQYRLGCAWIDASSEGDEALLKETWLDFSGATSIAVAQGTMNKAEVFALVRSAQGLHYVKPSSEQSMALVSPEELTSISQETLIVTPANEVFCCASRTGQGLSEWSLHPEVL